MAFDVRFCLRWWVFYHFLKASDASFTWIHSDVSVNFIQGQTATLSWSVDVGSGYSWLRVEITRNTIKSRQGDEDLISIVQAGSKKTQLQARVADLDLVVQGTSNVANVTFTLRNLASNTDDMYYGISVLRNIDFIKAIKFTKLNVLDSPQITNPQGQDCKSLTVNENQDVTLVCDATGKPTPTITWTKDGVPLSKQGSPLVLQNVVRNQTGNNYTCTADNGIGKADTACWKLDVQYIQEDERCGKTYQISTGQCLPVHPDGIPFPSVSCSSKVNVLVNHHGKTFNICGNKEKTNSNCTISNAVGGCSIKLKVQKQTAPVNKVWVASYRIINLEWNALLKNEFSEEFNTLKSKNDQMLKLVYAHQLFVTSLVVTDFREGRTGSVIVKYLLILNAHVADPSLPLKEALNSSGGTLGGLEIDPISIQASYLSTNEPQSTESCSGPSQAAFIAVCFFMSIFALIIIVAACIGCCCID